MEFRYFVAPLIIAFFTNPILFHKYLTEMVLNSNLHMDLSFQEKKKLFEDPTLGCQDIKQKPSLIFLGHPVESSLVLISSCPTTTHQD